MNRAELLQIAESHLRSVRGNRHRSLIITDTKAGNVEVKFMTDTRTYNVVQFNRGTCILTGVKAAGVKNWLADNYIIETVAA